MWKDVEGTDCSLYLRYYTSIYLGAIRQAIKGSRIANLLDSNKTHKFLMLCGIVCMFHTRCWFLAEVCLIYIMLILLTAVNLTGKMYCAQNICSFIYPDFLGNVSCSDKYIVNYTWDINTNASKSSCKERVLTQTLRHILVNLNVKLHEDLFSSSHLVTSRAVDREADGIKINIITPHPPKKKEIKNWLASTNSLCITVLWYV